MVENKTKATAASVDAFVAAVADPQRRDDSKAMLALMRKATGEKPKMFGTAIVGFGDVHYQYESGREGDWFVMGFSPRKAALALYLASGLDCHEALLAKLGRHKRGKGCLYIDRLAGVDASVLAKLLDAANAAVRKPSGR